ncbi:MAG TPA: hypothetical protein PKC45_15960 [Gemmatales bacterium]|nr:hypothetical protein [Gemmatales bacterium]
MTEDTAKKHLARMLKSFTAGSVLHMLADLFSESAEQARLNDETTRAEQCRTVGTALVVMGYGVDAALPR